jgi:hypothetical protein
MVIDLIVVVVVVADFDPIERESIRFVAVANIYKNDNNKDEQNKVKKQKYRQMCLDMKLAA